MRKGTTPASGLEDQQSSQFTNREDNSKNLNIQQSSARGEPSISLLSPSSSPSISTMPRPRPLLVGSSSQLRAPTSLLSSELPPTLLDDGFNGDTLTPSSSSSSMALVRPRRVWAIQDHTLPKMPSRHSIPPPIPAQHYVFIGDASPSIVAARISECLRKRSVAMEYDEESASATGMTVDRCVFQIQIYKIDSGISNNNNNINNDSNIGDPSINNDRNNMSEEEVLLAATTHGGIVVECQRMSGSVLSFHPLCRAILKAAQGQTTGEDTRTKSGLSISSSSLHSTHHRKIYHCNGREFQHLPQLIHSDTITDDTTTTSTITTPTASANNTYANPNSASILRTTRNRVETPSFANQDTNTHHTALEAVEQAKELVHKDRLDAKVLGMERLINLTSPSISGLSIARIVSWELLQQQHDAEWLLSYVVMPATATTKGGGLGADHIIDNSENDNDKGDNVNESLVIPSHRQSHSTTSAMSLPDGTFEEKGQPLSQIRPSAIRILCNALSVLSEDDTVNEDCNNGNGNRNGNGKYVHQSRLQQLLETNTEHPLVQFHVVKALADDCKSSLQRPLSLVHAGTHTGTSYTSIHESVLELRILRILARNSLDVYNYLQKKTVPSSSSASSPSASASLLTSSESLNFCDEIVELARIIGRTTHVILQEEAERTYNFFVSRAGKGIS